MTSKLIAFALSFTLTLCGLATAQNQQSWGAMALMRAGVRAGVADNSWINPDPNAANLMWWMSFDNIPMTNSLRVLSDIPSSGTLMWPRLDSGPNPAVQYVSATNSNGDVDYGLRANGAATWTSTGGWENICSRLGPEGWGNGITLSICSSNPFPAGANYNVMSLATTNAHGGPGHVFQLNINNSGQFVYRSFSNATLEANITGTIITNSHAVIVLSSNDFRAYNNAVLIGSDASCVVLPGTNRTASSPSFSAQPHYRDVRIYNKALSATEVTNLYNGLKSTNPIWCKPLNEHP